MFSTRFSEKNTFLTEKQETQRSPIRPVEVSYVSEDATDATDGYMFNFPIRWSSNSSTTKAIGLRRMKYTPCAATLSFYIGLTYGVTGYTTTNVNKTFTSQNTLEEIIADLNDSCSGYLDEAKNLKYSLSIIYYPSTAKAEIKFNVENLTESQSVSVNNFSITFTSADYANQFRYIFNQETDTTDIISAGGTGIITFTNVWNRQDLYFHSSFSDSTRQLIGCNNDFWYSPSVFYPAALNSDRFTLRFTQDTTKSIIPRHGVLLVQFSLIFNYNNFLD